MFGRSGNHRPPSSSTPTRPGGGMPGGGNGDQGGRGAKETPRSTPRETPHSTPRGVAPEEYRRLRELLEAKCDEVDDLGNNLKLAKESLRHLSERLDRTHEDLDEKAREETEFEKGNLTPAPRRHLSERLDRTNEDLEKAREENVSLSRDNQELRKSLFAVKGLADEKLEMASRLEQGLLKFQADLEQKEAHLQNEKKRLQQQLEENAAELKRREQRIHRLTTSMDGMEEGIAVGRVHVKKLSALLSQRS